MIETESLEQEKRKHIHHRAISCCCCNAICDSPLWHCYHQIFFSSSCKSKHSVYKSSFNFYNCDLFLLYQNINKHKQPNLKINGGVSLRNSNLAADMSAFSQVIYEAVIICPLTSLTVISCTWLWVKIFLQEADQQHLYISYSSCIEKFVLISTNIS